MPNRDMRLTMEIKSKFSAIVASARGQSRLSDPAGVEQPVTDVLIHANRAGISIARQLPY